MGKSSKSDNLQTADDPVVGAQSAIRKLESLTVAELMTRDVVTLRVDGDLDLAEQVMKLGRFRHVPVVDAQQNLAGLVTHRELVGALAQGLTPFSQQENRWFGQTRIARTIPIAKVMQRDPPWVTPDERAIDAAIRLKQQQLGCLLVLKDARLVGIVTEADFLGLVIRALGEDAPVSSP